MSEQEKRTSRKLRKKKQSGLEPYILTPALALEDYAQLLHITGREEEAVEWEQKAKLGRSTCSQAAPGDIDHGE